MTVDSMMLSEYNYQEKMYEKVYEKVLVVYKDLAEMHLDVQIPLLTDLLEFTYSDLYSELRDDLITEAMERKDYELHNMGEITFLSACYNGTLEDDSIVPHVNQTVFREQLYEVLKNTCLFVTTPEGYKHAPITEVW